MVGEGRGGVGRGGLGTFASLPNQSFRERKRRPNGSCSGRPSAMTWRPNGSCDCPLRCESTR